MNKKGVFSFKVLATSVSGIVAVIGAFVIWLSLQYNKPDLQTIGVIMIFAGLVGAIIIGLGSRLISRL